MRIRNLTQIIIVLTIYCCQYILGQELNNQHLRIDDRNARIQVLLNCDSNGLVSIDVNSVDNEKSSGSKFDIAQKGESYRLFVDKDEVWTWNSQKGYRLYRFSSDGTLTVIDPLAKNIKIPPNLIDLKNFKSEEAQTLPK